RQPLTDTSTPNRGRVWENYGGHMGPGATAETSRARPRLVRLCRRVDGRPLDHLSRGNWSGHRAGGAGLSPRPAAARLRLWFPDDLPLLAAVATLAVVVTRLPVAARGRHRVWPTFHPRPHGEICRCPHRSYRPVSGAGAHLEALGAAFRPPPCSL